MSVSRLEDIPGFNIDRVAAAAGDDPDVLRMENLDTDLRPPTAAIEATKAAIDTYDGNSWLPFTGRDDLKEAVASFIERRGGPRYDGRREIVITSGEGTAMLDALFCLTDPGDEVVLTDPTYAGMINRVRLVGAVPRLARLVAVDGVWRLDLDALRASVTERTRVIFIHNASFPSGWVVSDEEWEAIASLCRDHDLRLLYWGVYESVLFDGRPMRLPSAMDGMRDRTVTIGSGIEQRMIGWRVGWIVAPGELVNDVSRVEIYNDLVPSNFSQVGLRAAVETPDEEQAAAVAEYQRRRDETMRQLDGLPAVTASGGWSLLLDVAALGLDCAEVSQRLLEQRVAATHMRGWGGEVADRHVRFVFSREPVERIALLGERVRAALGSA
ncbi:MAG: N-succinyldiaminopimelate aminotransferase [Chloroflexota bacterium]|jgi:aspartate/methionine/tyrosine aminotransferase|nr:N-succinyldiaminopimelate aminotransferase [Chloroflexota bacterium]